MLSEKFCVGVRDPRCKLKSSVAQKKTHGRGYHLEFELGDRSRSRLGISYPLAFALGVSEPTRARYVVSLVLLVTVVTLGNSMCEEVGE